MSDKEMARRVELRLGLKNVTVPGDINKFLSSLTYTDEEEDKADDLQISFDDRERKWLGNWLVVKPQFVKSTKQVSREVQQESVINYVVQKGDTLSAIASKYLGSASKYPQIASENNIANPNLIYPGQVFKVTTGGTATTTVIDTVETTQKVDNTKTISATIVQKNWNDTGKDAVLDCGTFELDSIDASGPPTKLNLKGTSIPYTSTMRTTKKSRSWENISLKALANQIVSENGLKLMYEASFDPTYKRKEQVQTSDIKFLQKLCKAAGMALKVTTLTVVIYDAAEYDSKPAIKTIKFGNGDYISYKLGTSLHDTAYTSCHVSYTDPDSKETIESTFTPDSSEGTGQVLEINEKVRSTDEAYELAKKRLREKNTQQFTASFTMFGDVQLVAGATVKLKGFQEFDRKYKITKATHKITGGYTVDIELQQVLEGY
jgi:phage protein D